ncbi:hypothetical protein V5799_025123 [Amblyomma americanum]|uniref:Secreted protein n=1 Tax=Amblyomma americanum TaxID=6943 RepID=A0AAQ4EA56_AMBAM
MCMCCCILTGFSFKLVISSFLFFFSFQNNTASYPVDKTSAKYCPGGSSSGQGGCQLVTLPGRASWP